MAIICLEKKAISILAGNLNQGGSYIITTVIEVSENRILISDVPDRF